MSTSTTSTYTAKLTDGPLEGKTVSSSFLDTGDPRPTIEIGADASKKYVYARAAGQEFDAEGDGSPTAIDYRYLTTTFG